MSFPQISAQGNKSTKTARTKSLLKAAKEGLIPTPDAYVSNNHKENLCLEYVKTFEDNFTRLFPDRVGRYLTSKNEVRGGGGGTEGMGVPRECAEVAQRITSEASIEGSETTLRERRMRFSNSLLLVTARHSSGWRNLSALASGLLSCSTVKCIT